MLFGRRDALKRMIEFFAEANDVLNLLPQVIEIAPDRFEFRVDRRQLLPQIICGVRRLPDQPAPTHASVRGIRAAFNRPALFEERVPKMRNRFSQQFSVLFLWSEENKLDEAFRHLRRQLRHVDRLLPLNVLPNQLVDFAMQAASDMARLSPPSRQASRWQTDPAIRALPRAATDGHLPFP
jgi:hypothetical protein